MTPQTWYHSLQRPTSEPPLLPYLSSPPHQSYPRPSVPIINAMTQTPSLESSGLPSPRTDSLQLSTRPWLLSYTCLFRPPLSSDLSPIPHDGLRLSPISPIYEFSYFKREHVKVWGVAQWQNTCLSCTSPWGGGGRGGGGQSRKRGRRKERGHFSQCKSEQVSFI